MGEWWEEEPEQSFRPAIDPAELQDNQPATFNARSREAYEDGQSNYWARWGGPGHEHEYTVHVRGYGKNPADAETFIPQSYADQLQAELGEDFEVMNRGTRLEVRPHHGEAADVVVQPVFEHIFNSKETEQ